MKWEKSGINAGKKNKKDRKKEEKYKHRIKMKGKITNMCSW